MIFDCPFWAMDFSASPRHVDIPMTLPSFMREVLREVFLERSQVVEVLVVEVVYEVFSNHSLGILQELYLMVPGVLRHCFSEFSEVYQRVAFFVQRAEVSYSPSRSHQELEVLEMLLVGGVALGCVSCGHYASGGHSRYVLSVVVAFLILLLHVAFDFVPFHRRHIHPLCS